MDDVSNTDKQGRYAYYGRLVHDGVRVLDFTVRRLWLVVRIVTTSFIRDFVLHRFLHAKEELVIKSRVCLELEIESRLQ
jgi:hypothetical protein